MMVGACDLLNEKVGVYISVCVCVCVFGEVGKTTSGFGDLATFKCGQIFLSDHDIVHGGQKIESNRIGSKNSCK